MTVQVAHGHNMSAVREEARILVEIDLSVSEPHNEIDWGVFRIIGATDLA